MNATDGVRAELGHIADRFEQADARARKAQTIEDYEAAEAERREANGDFWAAESDLAELGLMLLRLALKHNPEAVRLYLAEALRPELETLAAAIAKMEGRVK